MWGCLVWFKILICMSSLCLLLDKANMFVSLKHVSWDLILTVNYKPASVLVLPSSQIDIGRIPIVISERANGDTSQIVWIWICYAFPLKHIVWICIWYAFTLTYKVWNCIWYSIDVLQNSEFESEIKNWILSGVSKNIIIIPLN